MSLSFISYAQPDQLIAKKIAIDLKNLGIDVWFDQQEILVGDSLIERITEGIQKSDYLIVILSKHSLKSKWVNREISFAFEKYRNEEKSVIIPAVIDNVKFTGDCNESGETTG